MKMSLPPPLKFFMASRRVVAVVILKNVGKIRRLPGGTVTFTDASNVETTREIKKMVARKVSLGPSSRFSAVILTFRFADQNNELSDLAEDRILATSAKLKVTITNNPAGPPGPTPFVIEDEEMNPAEEEGDEPSADPTDIDED